MDPAEKLAATRLVAVATIERPEDAAPLAEALAAGGLAAVEVALRTPRALDAIRAMKRAWPASLLGAGTVLTPGQADAARSAGADFGLAPGLDAATVRRCAALAWPFIPGVATASEIQAAIGLGCRLLKFFPAETLGGPRGLRVLAAPFAHIGVRFLPLGGIDAAALPAWLAEPSVAAVGGSWIAPPSAIRQKDWAGIARRAAEAVAAARPAVAPFA